MKGISNLCDYFVICSGESSKQVEAIYSHVLNQSKDIFVWAVEPRISEKPVRPRPLLYMAISGILALFVGMFLAFLIEFIRKNRTKRVTG